MAHIIIGFKSSWFLLAPTLFTPSVSDIVCVSVCEHSHGRTDKHTDLIFGV